MATVNGVNQGQRNVVHVQNDKGYKQHTNLGPTGKTRKRTRHILTPNEIAQIKKRKFIPRLFRCCRDNRSDRDNRNSRRTRKQSRKERQQRV